MNKIEEDAQVNGNHDNAEAEHDDDADEQEEQTVRRLKRAYQEAHD